VGWLLSVGCLSSRTSTSPFADLLPWFPWWGWIPYHPREHLPPSGWVLPVPFDKIWLSHHVLPKLVVLRVALVYMCSPWIADLHPLEHPSFPPDPPLFRVCGLVDTETDFRSDTVTPVWLTARVVSGLYRPTLQIQLCSTFIAIKLCRYSKHFLRNWLFPSCDPKVLPIEGTHVTEYGSYLESFEPGEATTTSGFQLRLVYFWNSSITVFSTIRFRVPRFV
jgi:hypothetical protein